VKTDVLVKSGLPATAVAGVEEFEIPRPRPFPYVGPKSASSSAKTVRTFGFDREGVNDGGTEVCMFCSVYVDMFGRKGAVLSWYISENDSEVMESPLSSMTVSLMTSPPAEVAVVVNLVLVSGKKSLSGGASAWISKRHLASYKASSNVMNLLASFFCVEVKTGTSVTITVWKVEHKET
jgi:hypothetical protein